MPYANTLAGRMKRSRHFQERYRSDPEFRLAHLNRGRRYYGREPVETFPPVGEARPAWAASRERDDLGRFA